LSAENDDLESKNSSGEGYTLTPWSVKGEIDYEELIERFGSSPISDELLERIERLAGPLPVFLRRKVYYSHRDLDWILNRYEAGEKFFLYTGRGPSYGVHLGHLVPWIFTKYLQEKFEAELYFQLTDDEKFLHGDLTSVEEARSATYDNILDVIAVGFDARKTFIFSDLEYTKTLYSVAVKVAKHVTFSTVKAVFGFDNSANIGIAFFPALQASPCFLPSVLSGHNIPCLIPASVDQDPYWRGIAREVAPKLGFYKPAQILGKFLPGLLQGGKMSSSQPESAVFTKDTPEEAERKIMSSFTGGRATVEEQRRLGGQADICPVYHYYYFLFEENDDELSRIYEDCTSGKLLCGDCKAMLASRVRKFSEDFHEKREKAREVVDDYIVADASGGLRKKSQK
jgi:tryptophanyl-tRNA synthetase